MSDDLREEIGKALRNYEGGAITAWTFIEKVAAALRASAPPERET